MGGMIHFTNNYRDCSTDNGFQFEFYCDGCGTGLMSGFKASKMGMAGGVLKAAGNFFGGLSGASSAADSTRELMRGKERDEALREAVDEAKKVFKLCGRCGKWNCVTACWNDKRNMCEKCAPDLEEELVSVQDNVKVEQMWRKARSADMLADVDITQDGGKKATVNCSACGAPSTGGKFCGECGAEVKAKLFCTGCGGEYSPGAKFCGTCGTKLG